MKWLHFALLILPFQASWAVDNACLRTINDQILEQNHYLFRSYKRISVTGPGVSPGNEGQILLGYHNEGVILFHGFLASPFEVLELGRHLNSKGYTVYMPLIFGFGSDAIVAGEATLEDWKLSVSAAVKILRKCFEKIHLMGFSLGGGLSADFVLKERPTDIASLTLLAPYFQPNAWYSKMVNSIVTPFTDSISLARLFSLSEHPDLVIPLKFQDHYNNFLPMNAVNTLHELRDELKEIPSREAIPVRTLIAYSEADRTIDYKFALQYTLEHFSPVRAKIFRKEEGLVHQITVSSESNNPTKLFEFVERFLKDKR